MSVKKNEAGNILIIEDTQTTINFLVAALEDAGYSIFIATSGEMALQRAVLVSPDLILLDILLPDIDGYEICSRLKAMEKTRDIPIIFISALSDTFDKVKGFNLGAVDYISKPIAIEEMLSRIQTHLTIFRLRRELVEANSTLEAKILKRTLELERTNEVLKKEIQEHTRTEESLLKTNRAYHALMGCSNAVSSIKDETRLLQEVCRIVQEDCGYSLVWIGFAMKDEAKTVQPIAYEGYNEGYLKNLNITWADTERGRGPTGTAIRTGKPVIVEDIMIAPLYTPWRADAMRRGFASSAAFPFDMAEESIGVLSIYAPVPHAFGKEEVALLIKIAANLSAGLFSIKAESQRDQAQTALQQSEQRLREVMDNSMEAAYRRNIKTGDYDYLSPAIEKILGYTPEEMGDMPIEKIIDLIHPDDRDHVATLLGISAVDGGGPYHLEYRLMHKKGEYCWLSDLFVMMMDESHEPQFRVGSIRDVTQQKLTEEQILASLKEKEILLKEIHHRVKNNLGIIYSLLHFQRKEINDPKMDVLLKNLQSRIQSIALIHQKLSRSGDIRLIEFGDYVRDLIAEIMKSYVEKNDNIQVKLSLDSTLLDIDTMMPLGLILNELFSNSLRHGFPDHRCGEIEVVFQVEQENVYRLSVTDNGIGIQTEIDWGNVTSMGLMIVFSLVQQLNGQISVQRDHGTAFVVRFNTRCGQES